MTGLTRVEALLRSLAEEMDRLELSETTQPLDFNGIESDPTAGAASVADFKSAVHKAIFAGRRVVPNLPLEDTAKAAEVAVRQLDAPNHPPAQTALATKVTEHVPGEALQTTKLAKTLLLKEPKAPAFAIEVVEAARPAMPPASLPPIEIRQLPQPPVAEAAPAIALVPAAMLPSNSGVPPQVPNAPLQKPDIVPPVPAVAQVLVVAAPKIPAAASPEAAPAALPQPSHLPDALVELMQTIYSISQDEKSGWSYITGLQEKSGDLIRSKTPFPRFRGAFDNVFLGIQERCNAFQYARIKATLKEGQIHLDVTVFPPQMPMEYVKGPLPLEFQEERAVHELADFLIGLPCQIQLRFAPFPSPHDAEKVLTALSRRTKDWNIDEISMRFIDSHSTVALFRISQLMQALNDTHKPLLIRACP